MTYFSKKGAGEVLRTGDRVTATVWRGLTTLLAARIANGSLGAAYPEIYLDGAAPIGTN